MRSGLILLKVLAAAALMPAAAHAQRETAQRASLSLEGAERAYSASADALRCEFTFSDTDRTKNAIKLQAETAEFAVMLTGSGFAGPGSYTIADSKEAPFRITGVIDKREQPISFTARAGEVSLVEVSQQRLSGRIDLRTALPNVSGETRFQLLFEVPGTVCVTREPVARVIDVPAFIGAGVAARVIELPLFNGGGPQLRVIDVAGYSGVGVKGRVIEVPAYVGLGAGKIGARTR
jgi:hypothetical protein